jgi:hypothetical protein
MTAERRFANAERLKCANSAANGSSRPFAALKIDPMNGGKREKAVVAEGVGCAP